MNNIVSVVWSGGTVCKHTIYLFKILPNSDTKCFSFVCIFAGTWRLALLFQHIVILFVNTLLLQKVYNIVLQSYAVPIKQGILFTNICYRRKNNVMPFSIFSPATRKSWFVRVALKQICIRAVYCFPNDTQLTSGELHIQVDPFHVVKLSEIP